LQRCLLTSAAGREQGGRQHVRRQDYRQEGAQGQGGLTRERDQGSQEVITNIHLLFMIAEIKVTALQRKSHLCIPFLGIARPQPQFQHSCACERFIKSQDRSTYFLQQNRETDRGNI
jgi:hypothetical protein